MIVSSKNHMKAVTFDWFIGRRRIGAALLIDESTTRVSTTKSSELCPIALSVE